eukprot:218495_1
MTADPNRVQVVMTCRFGCGAYITPNGARVLDNNGHCSGFRSKNQCHHYQHIDVQKHYLSAIVTARTSQFSSTLNGSTSNGSTPNDHVNGDTNPNHIHVDAQAAQPDEDNHVDAQPDNDIDDDQYWNMLGWKCSNCYKLCRQGDKFCPECGTQNAPQNRGFSENDSENSMNENRRDELNQLRIRNLKSMCQERGISMDGVCEKSQLIDLIISDEECNGEESEYSEEGDNEEKEVVSSKHKSNDNPIVDSSGDDLIEKPGSRPGGDSYDYRGRRYNVARKCIKCGKYYEWHKGLCSVCFKMSLDSPTDSSK